AISAELSHKDKGRYKQALPIGCCRPTFTPNSAPTGYADLTFPRDVCSDKKAKWPSKYYLGPSKYSLGPLTETIQVPPSQCTPNAFRAQDIEGREMPSY
ncbi:16428_t:CDS:2, partial [Dentiscutata erythropus]